MEPNSSGYNGQGLGSSSPWPDNQGQSPVGEWPPGAPNGLAQAPLGMPLPTARPQPGVPPASPLAQQTAAPSQATSSLRVAAPAIADDADLIEKEWVEAAKQIVVQTQGDPYSLSRAMNILRADYMKKRYGKDIKVPES